MNRFVKFLNRGKAAASALPLIVASHVYAADTIDPAPLVEGIGAGKPVIIAVAGAVFALIGIVVAIAYAKRAAK